MVIQNCETEANLAGMDKTAFLCGVSSSLVQKVLLDLETEMNKILHTFPTTSVFLHGIVTFIRAFFSVLLKDVGIVRNTHPANLTNLQDS